MKKCPKKNCNNEAQQHPTFGVLPCEEHMKSDSEKARNMRNAPAFASITMADRIQGQRDHNLGEIAQPWDENGQPNPTFIKANPEAVKDYFSEEDLKQL
jgi:hypothetical protein